MRSKREIGWSDGRIVASSARFVALALLNEEIHPNGFSVYRRRDVSFEPAPNARFQLRALSLRRERLPRLPRIDLGSWGSIAESAAEKFSLVTVHVEHAEDNASVCYIGVPRELGARSGTFLTIDPGAIWDPELLTVRWSEVVRMDFGGGYEEALSLVGGTPPAH
ncbi:MAG: hypothetical protein ACXVEE_09875 [Polyangiales bacterium]